MTDTLRQGTHNGHLMVAALKQHRDDPVMYLGDTTLTGGEVARRISQYVQAFEALGAGPGHAGGAAGGEPSGGAGQHRRRAVCWGWRRTALHPLGSLDDHAYVLADAGIETLIVDPWLCSPSGRRVLLDPRPRRHVATGAHLRKGPQSAEHRARTSTP